MATKTLLVLGDLQGTVVADNNSSANTVPLRDSSGGLPDVKSTGTLTCAVHAALTTTATLDATATNWTVDGTGGAFTATLPAASTCAGREYRIVRKDNANNVTIKGNASENINSANTVVLSSQYQALRIFCDGTQWWSF